MDWLFNRMMDLAVLFYNLFLGVGVSNLMLLCYGATFAAEAGIAFLYCDRMFVAKRSLPFQVFSFLLGFFLLFLIFNPNWALINSVSFTVLHFLLIGLNYQTGIWTALLNAGMLTLLMNAGELCSIALVGWFVPISTYQTNPLVLGALIVISKLIYLLAGFLYAFWFHPGQDGQKYLKVSLLLSLIPVFSSVILGLWLQFSVGESISSTDHLLLVSFMLSLLIINILILFVYHSIQKMSAQQIEQKLAAQKESADTAYYRMLGDQYQQQRILIHDIRGHLQTLDQLASDGKLEELHRYLSQLSDSPALQRKVRFCDNAILNVILTHCADTCWKEGVRFTADIRDGSVGFMEEADLSALFGNLLSNALEAAVSSSGKRIELSVDNKPQPPVFLLTLVNSCDCPPAGRTGRFVSRKPSPGHGVGQKSIARVVDKYGGQLQTYYDGDKREFHCIAVFPR